MIILINNSRKTGNEYDLTVSLSINKSACWMVSVQCLWGLNILWLQNWQVQANLPRCLFWDIRCHVVSFFAFPAGSLVASWKTIEPPQAALLPHTNCPSAVPVEFHNYYDSVTRVARRLQVCTMCSMYILLQYKGDHFGPVHSDQMVLEMIRRGEAGPVKL